MNNEKLGAASQKHAGGDAKQTIKFVWPNSYALAEPNLTKMTKLIGAFKYKMSFSCEWKKMWPFKIDGDCNSVTPIVLKVVVIL